MIKPRINHSNKNRPPIPAKIIIISIIPLSPDTHIKYMKIATKTINIIFKTVLMDFLRVILTPLIYYYCSIFYIINIFLRFKYLFLEERITL